MDAEEEGAEDESEIDNEAWPVESIMGHRGTRVHRLCERVVSSSSFS